MAFAEDPARATAVKIADGPSIPIPQRPAAPERSGPRFRFLDGLLVLVVLLFAFLTALFPAYNGDFLLHAATGRLIAHGQYQVGVDPFAFTTQDAVWINHSWLYDWIVFLLYDSSTVGGTILIVLKALMIAALAEVMLRTAREPGRSLLIPAACVGLAVLALSPRVFLQPVVVSFFFLGLTLWLLHRPRQFRGRTNRPFLPYWLIPPLCLLWVNLDEWFLLGPIAVALYLLGETLQVWFGPASAGADSPAPGERRALLLVLLASVAACLVNPHHIGAFVLPSQLGLGEAADALRTDSQFRVLFLSPLDDKGLYFYPSTGLNAAGLAYFPLVLLGVVSFAAAQWVGRWRWERLLLWGAFFALSLWHARAIPFFAVVSGPIASLNFLDFAAKRFGLAPRRGTWALSGRILTLLAGLVLVALSWPGWLQAMPWEGRRVGWTVAPNPALKQMAEQIAAWRKSNLIKKGAPWFNTAPEVLYYLAWYCPGERAFIDNQRLSLYNRTTAEEFAAMRQSLAREKGDAAAANPKWRKVLRDHDASLLIWFDARPFPLVPTSPLPTLLSAPKEWPLLYMNGRTGVFGWRSPLKEEAPDPFAALEFDSNKAAFGPNAVTAPAEAPPSKPREWWTAYWTPDPPRSADSDEAALQWLHFEVLGPLWRERNEKKWDALWEELKRDLQISAAVACLGSGNQPGGALEVEAIRQTLALTRDHSPMPASPPRPGEEMQYSRVRQLFDFGPPDALYLGVRAGRRAIAAKADDASSYQYIAQNYMTLAQQTREGSRGWAYSFLLRRIQIATALHHALEYDPNMEGAHVLALQLYLETGFLDLAKDHAEKRQLLLLASPDEPTRRQAEAMGKQIAKLEKEAAERQTTYELHAAGQPPLGKVKAAQELGLGQTALEVLEKIDWRSFDKDDPNKVLGVQKELSLMLQTGRADEVGKTLMEDDENLKGGLGFDPETGLPAYEWLRVQTAAAMGDYAEADRWLQTIQENTRQTPRFASALQQLGMLVLQESPTAAGAAWAPITNAQAMLPTLAELVVQPLEQQADLDALRGWLALEAGRTDDAREDFTDALRHASPGNLPFQGRPLTQLGLEWLDAAK